MQAVGSFKSLCQSWWQKQFTTFFDGHSQSVPNWHARNSIFSELIVYPRKLAHITGITKSCKSSMLISHSKVCDSDGVSIFRKAWGRNEGMLTLFLCREKEKNYYFSLSEDIRLPKRYLTDPEFSTKIKCCMFFWSI